MVYFIFFNFVFVQDFLCSVRLYFFCVFFDFAACLSAVDCFVWFSVFIVIIRVFRENFNLLISCRLSCFVMNIHCFFNGRYIKDYRCGK